jgi:hypothetical protein
VRIPSLVGLKVGRLLVIERAGLRGTRREWLCRCDCGTEKLIVTSHLTSKSNPTLSCGCIHSERVSGAAHRAVMLANAITHGRSKTPTYTSWADMIQRCTNPKRSSYQRYGARGITVCDRWLNSFESFLSDMGERPDGTTIDRINNSGNYEPDNCRWATPREQSYNSSNTKLTDEQVDAVRSRVANGERQTDVARDMGVTVGHINNIVHCRVRRSA